MKRLRGGILGLAAVVLLSAPGTASASFHEVFVREVYVGGASNDSYVVLQAYASGQNFVGGSSVTAYDAGGNQIGSATFGGSVANGANQMTMLVADTAYSTTFDTGPPPDRSDASLNLNPLGGAVCWAGIYDCVSWGSFNGSLSSPAGTPVDAGGIPNGMAIRRSIAPNCATLLEFGDDSNNSAADFSDAAPNPRNNASPITEIACTTPITSINTKPRNPTNSTSATFTFTASPPAGATFQCKLDAGSFADCNSGTITYPEPLSGDSELSEGSHTFQVKATNVSGPGPTASYTWRIDLTAPVMTINSKPTDPSSGASATFTYQPNESVMSNSTQCRLDTPGETGTFDSCAGGTRTYTGLLVDGTHTFMVRATDQAGNQSTPAVFPAGTYSWRVDNSLTDRDPPETTITSKPSDPSTSSTAMFTYSSNEPGSTFRCKLDGGAFAPCPAGRIEYTGLLNGPHTFRVQATDPSNNTDATPAGYSWAVAVPDPTHPPPVVPPPPNPSPNTRITGKPAPITKDRTPTFRFQATINPAAFECKLDRAAFRLCRSPFTTRILSFGRHMVRVRAIAGGVADPSPAKFPFKVARRKPRRR